MLRRIDLTNFKAFERFTVHVRGDTFLVGPNNAGKSTLIAAVRASANMLRIASRLRATDRLEFDGVLRSGHSFSGKQVDLVQENLRHEFHPVESRVRLVFDDDAELVAIWPPGDDEFGFFCVRHRDVTLRQPREVKKALPNVGLVPILSPMEHEEEPLSEGHVRANLDSRLASRHFRNQLYLLSLEKSEDAGYQSRLEEFRAFAEPWLVELKLEDLKLSLSGDHPALDCYYSEPDSAIHKEVFWSGDGMQIWLQLLLHLFRLRNADVILLDEPDVFLHSDLQRRLVDLLESIEAQVITATHSPEVLAEAEPNSVIWVSRNRRQGVRAPSDRLLFELSDSLGTQFNLRLARTLRARCVLFVEGQDVKVLRHIARTVGAKRVYREDGLVVVPLDGFDRWEHLDAFQWLTDKLLEKSVRSHVILDRDHRDQKTVSDVERRLRKAGLDPHVWQRHELENYLLSPTALARLSGADQSWIEATLTDIVAGFEDDVYAGISTALLRAHKQSDLDGKAVIKLAKQEADAIWKDATTRQDACPGKQLLSRLNERLQADGHQTVTPRLLASRMQVPEIPAELRKVLRAVDAASKGS